MSNRRDIIFQSGLQITKETIKEIVRMSALSMKNEIVGLNQSIDDLDTLAIYEEMSSHMIGCLNIIMGSDWYIIFIDDEEEIEIYSIAKIPASNSVDYMTQIAEINKALEYILYKSIRQGLDGEVYDVKKINVNLCEDTSYILYLLAKKNGKIIQLGFDYLNKIDDDNYSRRFKKEDQEDILKRVNEIKRLGNREKHMHFVTFIPTEEEIEKLLTMDFSDINEEEGPIL